MKPSFVKIILVLIFLFVLSVLLAIFKGSVGLEAGDLLSALNRPILNLRIFRVLVAVIAGSGLAVSGVALQAILRNSLAEPYLLGTSSGAGLGAVVAVFFGWSSLYLPPAAFLGAILSILLVYNLARHNNKVPEQSLILSGVIVSVAISALIVFLISISRNEVLHSMTWWLWGSLQIYDFRLLFIVAIVVIAGIGVIYAFSQDLNAISIGEEEAAHLGIDVEKVKKILILVTSLITASLVCVCGIIGFVGLMVPHIMRLSVGPNHRRLIPATCLAAAIFMILCDLISRTVFTPLEIPIGVITALTGAPVFIFLMKRKQRGH